MKTQNGLKVEYVVEKKEGKGKDAPPRAVWIKPVAFETILLMPIGIYLRKRITPAIESNTPIRKKVSVSRNV